MTIVCLLIIIELEGGDNMSNEVDAIILKIKKRKNELGLTNKELSQKSQVSEGTLNKILGTETKEPSIGNVLKIIKALGLSESYVFSDNSVTLDFPPAERQLIADFRKLNENGQIAALAAVHGFTIVDQYKKDNTVSEVS